MQVYFNNRPFDFSPWDPQNGTVFNKHYVLSSATTAQDPARPLIAPSLVLVAVFDGNRGFFVLRRDLEVFLQRHARVPVVLHGAAHQLAVMKLASRGFDLYGLVEQKLVLDTELLHRLYVLATTGDTASPEQEHSFAECAMLYARYNVPRTVLVSGLPVPPNFGQWLNRELQEVEPAYLDHLAKNAIVTAAMCHVLLQKVQQTLGQAGPQDFGYVSREWLDQQIARWGHQTHHLQLQASIVLRDITQIGLHLDVKQLEKVREKLQNQLLELKKSLWKSGYMPDGKDSNKSLQGVLKRLEKKHNVQLPRRPDDHYATQHDALEPFANHIPFIQDLLQYRELKSLLDTFLSKIEKTVLHPSFNVLVRTGRTSSYGELNAQGISRDPEVRACIVPSDGKVFLDCDYRTIELVTLSQASLSQFRQSSSMAGALNNKHDLHRYMAAQILKIPLDRVTPQDREKAKVLNFGIPGGMGVASMMQYAKSAFGLELSEHDVTKWSNEWHNTFPEIQQFLHDDRNSMEAEIVRLFELDPNEISGLFGIDQQRPDQEIEMIACRTFLKVLREPEPRSRQGDPYPKKLLDYLWSRLEAKRELLSPQAQEAIKNRQASRYLAQEVRSLGDHGGVMTLTGRLRAKAIYTARRNTIFQGLAADGAKLALWRLWRSGFQIVNFIHDQFLLEIPRAADYASVIQRVESILVEAMRAVVPDVLVAVNSSIKENHWT